MSGMYRTLIRGKLRQDSSLSVGGSLPVLGGADIGCARDGRRRLTIPGTSLAGCLIDTAARVFPGLFAEEDGDGDESLRRITSKRKKGPSQETWESLWRFRPAHRDETGRVERRQGVGIRQETGAAAGEGAALFDIDTLPPGEEWDFFLDIDTMRGGVQVEAVALFALHEWMLGRCWLGASAARGLGWMTLHDVVILRLPRARDFIDAWPDNSKGLDGLLTALRNMPSVAAVEVKDPTTLLELARQGYAHLPTDRTCYVVLTVEVSAGEDGYGLDAVSVGGHVAGLLTPLHTNLLSPPGMQRDTFMDNYQPDSPVVASGINEDHLKPVLPGSGLRGPLRHAASRMARVADRELPDPNVKKDGKPPRERADEVSRLFGLVDQSARLLVSDGRLTDGCQWQLARWQHHAEDEFAASVFGAGKFDRTAVIGGTFRFKLAVEAKAEDMPQSLAALARPARLAELGFVPIGGAKTRGAGWLKWRFKQIEFGHAGEKAVTRKVDPGGIVTALTEAAKQFGGGEA